MQGSIIGKRFGRLIVLQYVGVATNHKSIFECVCDCGKHIVVKRNSLVTDHTKSCGCLYEEAIQVNALKHGLRNHALYHTWLNIKDRCGNPNNSHYKYYGGKGIKVCSEWANDFKKFYDWSLSVGWVKGLSIERNNNSKGYEPSNCRYIPLIEQCKNKTSNIMITINNETKYLAEWCLETGVNPSTAYSRINRGWDMVKAVTLNK